jgi:uncharacterized protein (DUF1499 family)
MRSERGRESGRLKALLQSLVVIVALVLITLVAVLMIGPDRAWSGFGNPDLGPVDFQTLERRTSPNDALACPPNLCRTKSDLSPPNFAMNALDLRKTMAKVLELEPRLTRVHSDDETLTDRYVQRTALLQFPDTIVVRYLDRPQGHSTLAIYSRSKVGYSDLGANRARIERWLSELNRKATATP